MSLSQKLWRSYNLIFLFLGISFGTFLYNYEPFHIYLLSLGNYEYIGAFLAGLLYDSTITVTTSIVVLLVLAENLPLFQIAIIAGIGAVLGDYLIFHFVKDNFHKDLEFIILSIKNSIGKKRVRAIKNMANSKYFNWTLPLAAAILIGSPFPNEVAWGLMGFTRIKTYQLILISFIFNFLGIILVLLASTIVKP